MIESCSDDKKETLTSKSVLKIDPVSIFPASSLAARFWFFVSCGLMLFVMIQPSMIIEQYKIKERIIVMDESGTFHVAPLQKFEDVAPMHDYIISVATNALLSRGPKGADNPPLIKQMFLNEKLSDGTTALKKVDTFYKKDEAHFRTKKIHQKAEVKEIKILKTTSKTVIANVRGQLIRIGTFEDQKFTNTKDFALKLTLYRNPKMTANGRLPMAILNWNLLTRDSLNASLSSLLETKTAPQTTEKAEGKK